MEISDKVEFSHQQKHADSRVSFWDRVGIFLSGLCALHCMIAPFLALFVPAAGFISDSEWVHIGLAFFVVPVGLAAFWLGYRHHQNTGIFALGLLGLLAIASAAILPHEWIELAHVDVVTILGSFILLSAHFWNRRACTCHAHG